MNNNTTPSGLPEASGPRRFFGINRATRAGSYSVVMSLLVLAVLVVINLIVGALPSRMTKLDTSAARLLRFQKQPSNMSSSWMKISPLRFFAKAATSVRHCLLSWTAIQR